MPVRRVHLNDLAITYVQTEEPFALKQLYDRAVADKRDPALAPRLGQPILLDFRAVNLARIPTEDFHRLIRLRRNLDKGLNQTPCAYVAGDDSSFGMLRLYTTYAEIAGLRRAEDAFVTVNFAEAIDWICARSGAAPASPASFAGALDAASASLM